MADEKHIDEQDVRAHSEVPAEGDQGEQAGDTREHSQDPAEG